LISSRFCGFDRVGDYSRIASPTLSSLLQRKTARCAKSSGALGTVDVGYVRIPALASWFRRSGQLSHQGWALSERGISLPQGAQHRVHCRCVLRLFPGWEDAGLASLFPKEHVSWHINGLCTNTSSAHSAAVPEATPHGENANRITNALMPAADSRAPRLTSPKAVQVMIVPWV